MAYSALIVIRISNNTMKDMRVLESKTVQYVAYAQRTFNIQKHAFNSD
jgi:hypothetical protein